MTKPYGSITIYLCLTLTIILSMFAAMLQSVRSAGGRTMIASAMDQGLFSLFAQYDRKLLEEYDLFYIDGGYGTAALQLGKVYNSVREDAIKSLSPSGHGAFQIGNFFGVDFTGGELTGYTLATDQTGNSFASQVSCYMRQRLGVSGIQQLLTTLTDTEARIQNQNYEKEQLSEGDPMEEYELQKDLDIQEPAAGDRNSAAVDYALEENPIEVIKKIQEKGILGLVTKDSDQISHISVDKHFLPEGRQLQQGMGVSIPQKMELHDKLLMMEYALEKFPCYTNRMKSEGLQYQIEYMIGEKEIDSENLKAVVNRLIGLREAANMVYLYTDPVSKAQADAMAASIAAVFLLPVAQPVIALALIACWAFAESVMDVRILLDGGKVPLIKDQFSWNIAVENLAKLPEVLQNTKKDGKGFDYQWYLRFLLFTKSQEHLTMQTMNLVEYNMNLKLPERVFRIDNCIASVNVQADWKVAQKSFVINRSYSYQDEEV